MHSHSSGHRMSMNSQYSSTPVEKLILSDDDSDTECTSSLSSAPSSPPHIITQAPKPNTRERIKRVTEKRQARRKVMEPMVARSTMVTPMRKTLPTREQILFYGREDVLNDREERRGETVAAKIWLARHPPQCDETDLSRRQLVRLPDRDDEPISFEQQREYMEEALMRKKERETPKRRKIETCPPTRIIIEDVTPPTTTTSDWDRFWRHERFSPIHPFLAVEKKYEDQQRARKAITPLNADAPEVSPYLNGIVGDSLLAFVTGRRWTWWPELIFPKKIDWWYLAIVHFRHWEIAYGRYWPLINLPLQTLIEQIDGCASSLWALTATFQQLYTEFDHAGTGKTPQTKKSRQLRSLWSETRRDILVQLLLHMQSKAGVNKTLHQILTDESIEIPCRAELVRLIWFIKQTHSKENMDRWRSALDGTLRQCQGVHSVPRLFRPDWNLDDKVSDPTTARLGVTNGQESKELVPIIIAPKTLKPILEMDFSSDVGKVAFLLHAGTPEQRLAAEDLMDSWVSQTTDDTLEALTTTKITRRGTMYSLQ